MSQHLIGKKIVLKSNSEIRYTGTLFAIDTAGNSISLVEVLSLGTEDRVTPGGYVPPANTIYPYVVFRAADVSDIAVIDEPVTEPQSVLPHDDAIINQGAPPVPAATQQAPQPSYASPPLVPPTAPSVATAHANTLQRVQESLQSPAVPTRQPVGPSVIPFEELAAGPSRRGPPPQGGRGFPARRARGGRAPGAFSHAAAQEDLSQEFDFAGMNQRFADLRSGEGEKSEDADAVEVVQLEAVVDEEKPKQPAYNKSSSFFDSVSSNIQTPGAGRGGGGRGRPSFSGRGRDQSLSNDHQSRLSGPPRNTGFSQQQQQQQQPGQGGNGRWNRRDETALNDLTFGEGSAADVPTGGRTGGGGGGGGRQRGNGNGNVNARPRQVKPPVSE